LGGEASPAAESPAGEHRTWPAAGLGMLGGSRLADSCRRLDRRRCRRAPVAWRRTVAAAALLVRHLAARRGPLVAGLAMGAEGKVARSAGTAGLAPRRHWPCRHRWRRQGAVMPCSASELPGAVAQERIRGRARRREREKSNLLLPSPLTAAGVGWSHLHIAAGGRRGGRVAQVAHRRG
jgi:hypothetical protein